MVKAIESRVLAPVGAIQIDTMPFKSSPLQKLIEAEARVFDHDVTAATKCNHHSDETVNVGMLFLQVPVEPTDLVVLAVCIVVAILGSGALSSPISNIGVPTASMFNRMKFLI